MASRRGNRGLGAGLVVAGLCAASVPVADAASERRIDDPLALSALTGDPADRPAGGAPVVQGGAGGFSWSMLGLSSDDERGRMEGQSMRLGYDNTNITLRGKWDNRYKARGGATFGATLDEDRLHAIGGGFLTNERASEFYGHYQFVATDFDPLSSFTIGEYASRERQFFTTGGAEVWGYTTYLNWFKRGDGRQSPDGDLPPALRTGLQTLMDNISAVSGTLAYTYAPMVRQGDEGSPRTNAIDLSLRAVTPAPFGEYFPVSGGVGVNLAHYGHVDATTQTEATGNGGMGIAFMGGDYFRHPIHWLVGIGGDGDTKGVAGGTIAAELGPVSASYRQTSDHHATVLVGWRVSDLWSDSDRQRASTLAVADGRAPLSFASGDRGAVLPDRIARAENSLMRMGFLPPTGNEVSRPSGNTAGSAKAATLQLSPASVAQQPMQVQQAIKRTQDAQRQVATKKNTDIRTAKAAASNTTTYPSRAFPGLTIGVNHNEGTTFTVTVTFAGNVNPADLIPANFASAVAGGFGPTSATLNSITVTGSNAVFSFTAPNNAGNTSGATETWSWNRVAAPAGITGSPNGTDWIRYDYN